MGTAQHKDKESRLGPGGGRAARPPRDAGGAPLVYTRKLIHPPGTENPVLDRETGELVPQKVVRDYKLIRAERWALKSTANRLLPAGHRTTKCHRWRVPDMAIQVHQGKETGRAFYHGLQVCSSVWACPVCASKISERRRVELSAAIAIAKARGWRVYLATLTFPHGLGDDLATIAGQLTDAWAKLNQGKAGMQLRQAIGLKGTVRALEVTHGANGWHPHLHALLFIASTVTPRQVQELLLPRWQRVATRCGLPLPSDEHGCRVDGGEKAAAYVAKGSGWGLESELTKGHQKRGKKGSRTPWDLLRDYADQDDKQAGALFRAYAEAFKGRRQLYWSNGLKALLAVADFTDEEIAAAPDDAPALLLATITEPQWKAIRRCHFESIVLDLAETTPEGLLHFLETIT